MYTDSGLRFLTRPSGSPSMAEFFASTNITCLKFLLTRPSSIG
uniref:Uncharacterized protein n=1 Tax=Rhizophora mucronata TaxID=61149 RepID=A0A2P2P5S6_RHIMU